MIVSNKIKPTPAYVLLKEVINLRKQLDKLQDELEAEHVLAETLGHYHEAAKAENEKLKAENEELREKCANLIDDCALLRTQLRALLHVKKEEI